MPQRIIYLPIEAYGSRYSQYTSVTDGCYERGFKDLGIDFYSIRPHNKILSIQKGRVLDTVQRSKWGFKQVEKVIELILDGKLDPDRDVIYLEDFFTPGFEMIPYAQSQKFGPNPAMHIPVYSFCHAQSLDPYDFTAQWAWWMRPLEKMWFDYQTKVFCAAREMLPLVADAGISLTKGGTYKVIPVGHVWNKAVVANLATKGAIPLKKWTVRYKTIVYSSRWDAEKNPNLALDILHGILIEDKDVEIRICTGNTALTINDIYIEERLRKIVAMYPSRVHLHVNLSLTHYYELLSRSKIQLNTALQDWISYTLLDATFNGCAPLYPKWRAFPDAVKREEKFLYENLSVDSALEKLKYLLNTNEYIDVHPIHEQYEDTVKKICKHMGFATV